MNSMSDSQVEGFILMKFKAEAVAAKGWPSVEYPVPAEALVALIDGKGELEAPQMLAWMQHYVAHTNAPWRDYREAMRTLLEICSPADDRDTIDAGSDRWSLVCGPVDLDAKVVSFCRDGDLLAVAGENADGRIRVASYQPLDGRTVSLIIGASCLPAPDGTVCMRPNNWEYLGDNACGNGQIYAAIDGQSYMSLWKHGLGVTTEQGLDPEWHHVRDLTPLSAAALATSLGVYYSLGPAER